MTKPKIVVILDNGYDIPQVQGFYTDYEEAKLALFELCSGEKFTPDGDWESIEDWYLGADAGYVTEFNDIAA